MRRIGAVCVGLCDEQRYGINDRGLGSGRVSTTSTFGGAGASIHESEITARESFLQKLFTSGNNSSGPTNAFLGRHLNAVPGTMRRLLSAPSAMALWFLVALTLAGTGFSPKAEAQQPTTVSMWTSAVTPGLVTDPDPSAVELGVKFRTTAPGFVSAIRFYKGPQNVGPHVAKLWTSAGALLASAPFTNETAQGWQEVALPAPVAIAANTTYVASYHTASGFYSADQAYFATSRTSGPLTFLANGQDGGNGVYAYGSGGFPAQTYNASNYWVDVVFSTTTGGDVTPPTITSTAPADGATGVSTSASVTANFSEPMAAASISGTTVLLRDGSGTLVPAAVSYSATPPAAVLAPSTSLASGTTYTATILGGTGGVTDVAGNPLAATLSWAFTTAQQAPAQLVAAYGFNEGTGTTTADLGGTGNNGTLTNTTWSTLGKVGNALTFNGTSARVNVADSNSLDLTTGMALEAWVFPTSLSGTRTVVAKERTGGFAYGLFASNGASRPSAAIRVGTTTISVAGPSSLQLNAWSHLAATYNGAALVLYVNGTQVASQAAAGSMTTTTLPLRIGGITTVTGQYFAGRIDEVRVYNQAVNAAQVQADMVTPVDLVPPTITARSPAAGATGVSNSTTVTATFSEAIAAATISGTTFQLRDPSNNVVPAAVTFNATNRIATLAPGALLGNGITYTASVAGGAGGVTDVSGNAMAAAAVWSFTTAGTTTAGTTTAITSSVNPSVFGQGVTFSATVTPVPPATGTPTGTVQFQVGGANLGAPVALASGVATSPVANTLTVGNQSVSAIYSGDANFTGSTSPALTQTVNKANTSASIAASSVNPSVFGEKVTLTATVAPVFPRQGPPAPRWQ